MNFNYNISPVNNILNTRFCTNQVSNTIFTKTADTYTANPLYEKFSDIDKIAILAKSNPRIMNILHEYKIPLKVNAKALEELKAGHLRDTRVIASKIYSALPENLKHEVNPVELQEAAMLHDYGKVLIPDKILNKKGKLTGDEKKIMELHSELGYELLKQQGVNENVLNMVKYHHQTPDGKGYPAAMNGYKSGLAGEILAAADKYSALTEKRCYKDAISHEDAVMLMQKDVKNGILSPEVYNALIKAV